MRLSLWSLTKRQTQLSLPRHVLDRRKNTASLNMQPAGGADLSA